MIYEYQCRSCQERFNAQMSLAEHDKGETGPRPRCKSR